MELRPLSPRYTVSPQISVEDIPAIAEAGITLLICNRPDEEIPVTHQSEAIAEAARKAGLRYEVLPITRQTMTHENVTRQRDLIDGSDGPVLAYCATGTRCSIIWALGQAASQSADEILASTTAAGYQLEELRPMLERLSKS